MSDLCLIREPVFGTDKALLGWEIRYRDTGIGASALTQMFEFDTFDQVRRNKPVFMASTPEQLLGNSFQLADASTLTLLLPTSTDASSDLVAVIEQFRAVGGTIGLDDLGENPSPSESLLPHASWVRLAAIDTSSAAIELIRARIKARNDSIKFLAYWIEEREHYDVARLASVDAFQGSYFAQAELVSTNELPPSSVAAIQLLGMARDPNVTDRELEEVLESDPVLTFQLLQLVNSAAVGLRGVSSIGQALRLIGRVVFQRWLAVAVAGSRKSSNGVDDELVQRALSRGRLMEEFSGNGRDAGTLFLVGLFSLLDTVFRIPLPEILKRVALSDDATAALRDRQGPYAGALSVAEAYERGQFDKAAELAQSMGLDLSVISKSYTSAVKWTAEALDSLSAQPAPRR